MIDKNFLDYEEKLSVSLYKYYGNLNYAKDVIENQRIHFEPPSKYNDIFDSATYITDDQLVLIKCETNIMMDIFKMCLDTSDKDLFDREILPKHTLFGQVCAMDVMDLFFYFFPNANKDLLFELLRTVMSLQTITTSDFYKITCFSENKDSLLMWSYYANSHKGVCLEFDLKNDKELVKHCHKVQYTKHFDVGNESYTYFTKSDQWQHEQEWRIVKYGDEYERTNSLRAIYLGFKMDKDEMWEFIQLGKKYKLDVYFVKPAKNKYKLECVRIFKVGELSVEEIMEA